MSTNNIITIFTIVIATSMSSCGSNPYVQGERVYTKYCSNCHMEDGSGLNKLIPSLSTRIPKSSIIDQVCIIQNGFNADSLGSAMNVMPAFDRLRDVELTNLINYINYNWNDSFEEHTVQEVLTSKSQCH